MDDNIQFNIPKTDHETGSFNESQNNQIEASPNPNVHDDSWSGADIVASSNILSDEPGWNISGWHEALSNSESTGIPPATIRQLTDRASLEVDRQFRSREFIEQDTRARRQLIEKAKNVRLWRNYVVETSTSSSGHEIDVATKKAGFMRKLFAAQALLPSRRAITERELMRQEAKIGGKLFREDGVEHLFFCFDEHCWVWHREARDSQNRLIKLDTRFEVRPTGILKAQDGTDYHAVDPSEEQNLIKAGDLYYKQVMKEIYDQDVELPIAA